MLDDVLGILGSVDTDDPHLPPTALYNEGWLLRLVLAAMKRHGVAYPFPIESISRWYSEALLNSAFLASAGRPSNSLAESHTHADGVVGQFEFRPQTRGGIVLSEGAKQFVVCEAKLFSLLSESVTNAPGFNQAARNVACMAETMRLRPDRAPRVIDVGFYVLAPREQIDKGVFDTNMTRESIEAAVADRVLDYRELDPERYAQLCDWERDHLKPLLDLLDSKQALKCVTWESVIQAIQAEEKVVGDRLAEFYARCLKVNRPASDRAIPVIGGRPVSGGYYQIDEGGDPRIVRVVRVGSRNSRVLRMDRIEPSFKIPNGMLSPIDTVEVRVEGGPGRRVRKGGVYHWTDKDGTRRLVRVTHIGPANSRVQREGDENGDSFLVPNHTLTDNTDVG